MREFDAIYKNADKVWHTQYFVLFYLKDENLRKVAFVAGKKVGNAVKRNRAKRLMRALFLEFIDQLATGSYVLVAKPKILGDGFDTLRDAFGYALKRSGSLLSKR